MEGYFGSLPFKGRFHQQVERVHLGENAIIPLPPPATEQIWSRPRRIERVQLVGETGPKFIGS